MSRIHHSQKAKAEKMGVHLEESGQFIKASWPMRNVAVFGVDARWAIEQMEAVQRLIRHAEDRGSELTVRTSIAQPTMVHLIIDGEPTKETNAPMVWWNQVNELVFSERPAEPMVAIKVVGPQGEPIDEEPETTNSEADQPAVEDKDDAEDEALPAKSVVKQKYRAIYAEAGHPAHCGDEMAEKLNNLVTNGKGTDIEYFQMIMAANEIDMSKYRTSGNGWQGRYRMTGRNMLAKRVHANGGVLNLPNGEHLQMSADWMANQRFQK